MFTLLCAAQYALKSVPCTFVWISTEFSQSGDSQTSVRICQSFTNIYSCIKIKRIYNTFSKPFKKENNNLALQNIK